ncbi:MAG: Stf0 family sulfotransferase [Pseudomonadota bacterium]
MIRKPETEQLVADLLPVMGLRVLARVVHELKLPPEEPEYRLRGEKILVMLFAARAGSTYTGALIQNLPQFGIFTESLNPRALERARLQYGLDDHGAALQSLLDHRGRDIFGFRCTQIGLAGAAATGLLSQFRDRLSFVILRRRNVTAQAVSMVRAQLSGQFHSFQQAEKTVSIDDYDFEMIDNRRRKIDSIYSRHEKVLEALGATAHTVYYEDIVADPGNFLVELCRYLNIDMPPDLALETRVSKLPNRINVRWIERYNAEAGIAEPSAVRPIAGLLNKLGLPLGKSRGA